MIISGIQKCSLIDYPHKVATVIFTQGCNFNCSFCHNAQLIPHHSYHNYSVEDVYDFLSQRKGKIQGVVVSGGEPTLQPDLLKVLAKIKRARNLFRSHKISSKA